MFTKEDKEIAKRMKKLISLNIDQEAFRIHSKGMGCICIKFFRYNLLLKWKLFNLN